MEVDNESTSGSVANLKQKPPTKGRKKKSAVAKLAEKKRLNSEGGSEYGSTVSLQRLDSTGSTGHVSGNRNESGENKNRSSGRTDNNNEKIAKPETSVTDENKKNDKNDNDIKTSDDVFENKEKVVNKSPPKPVPRKLNRRNKKVSDPALDALDGGTVVSIYDKLDKTPPGRKRKDSSPSRNNKNGKVGDDITPSSKRELFPSSEESKLNALSFLGPSKPKGGLSPLSDLPPLDKGSSQFKNVELSPPVPMDLDNGSDDENIYDKDAISKNAPSDATVHRFRALRMAPDRSKSEESLRNVQFVPKPPSTPRSARRNSAKGEKRTREANSSGEEADIENKKQNSVTGNENIVNTSLSNLQTLESVKMEIDEVTKEDKSPPKKGLSMHPNVKEVHSDAALNINQNMNVDSPPSEDKGSLTSGAPVESPIEISPDKNFNISPDKLAFESSPENKDSVEPEKKLQPEKKTSKKKIKKSKVKPFPETMELGSLDGSNVMSPGKSSIDTIGSASDLKAISDNYREVLLSDPSPNKQSSMPRQQVMQGLSADNILPEPKLNASKLAPIQPKTLPPPLPHDMKSSTLRTTYKADPTYNMSKFFGRSFSGPTEKEKAFDTMSHRSFSTSTTLHALSTREARDRMKQGNMGSSLLSSSELDRYFPDRKVGLWVGSWNMAEIKDCKVPLDDFLLPEISEYVQDIYAIGSQENAMSKKEWEILLQETIGPSHVLFHSASHGALHLAVFVKRDLIWFCTVPEDDLVQTRAVTMVKTKGAIAIGFNFFGTSLLFINCHFAPGDERKKERVDDFTRIIKQLHLPKQNTGSPNGNTQDVTTRYDCVFWMGDLNFRIEAYKGKQAVEDLVKSIQGQEHPNFEDLVSGDQLTKLIIEGNIFQGFQEGRINFRPTYKFDIGNDTYDTSSKNRIPSYTDRVLFRAKKKNSITCTYYDSPHTIKLSDHRPVFALFEAAVKPGRECTQPLAAGQFDRSVYTEANRRRTLKVEVIKTLQKDKSSKVCSIQ